MNCSPMSKIDEDPATNFAKFPYHGWRSIACAGLRGYAQTQNDVPSSDGDGHLLAGLTADVGGPKPATVSPSFSIEVPVDASVLTTSASSMFSSVE